MGEILVREDEKTKMGRKRYRYDRLSSPRRWGQIRRTNLDVYQFEGKREGVVISKQGGYPKVGREGGNTEQIECLGTWRQKP